MEELHQIQLYKPELAELQPRAPQAMTAGQCQSIGDLDDSQLVGAPEAVVGKEMSREDVAAAEVKSSVGKRRRGRPPGQGGQGRPKAATPARKKNDEEDVCFICFDGGSLVLCDRR